MRPTNPIHNPAGYLAIAVMAIGAVLLAIGNFALRTQSFSYRVVTIAGSIAMIIGATSLAFVYVKRRNRDRV
jgi:membrane-bound ClpP family serine protease